MYSLCYKCSNARADRCKKILDGTPIKGWVAEPTKCGGYLVKECPQFKQDQNRKGMRVTVAEIARVLNVSERLIYRRSDEYIIGLLKARGYNIKIVYKNRKRLFYLNDK